MSTYDNSPDGLLKMTGHEFRNLDLWRHPHRSIGSGNICMECREYMPCKFLRLANAYDGLVNQHEELHVRETELTEKVDALSRELVATIPANARIEDYQFHAYLNGEENELLTTAMFENARLLQGVLDTSISFTCEQSEYLYKLVAEDIAAIVDGGMEAGRVDVDDLVHGAQVLKLLAEFFSKKTDEATVSEDE